MSLTAEMQKLRESLETPEGTDALQGIEWVSHILSDRERVVETLHRMWNAHLAMLDTSVLLAVREEDGTRQFCLNIIAGEKDVIQLGIRIPGSIDLNTSHQVALQVKGSAPEVRKLLEKDRDSQKYPESFAMESISLMGEIIALSREKS